MTSEYGGILHLHGLMPMFLVAEEILFCQTLLGSVVVGDWFGWVVNPPTYSERVPLPGT